MLKIKLNFIYVSHSTIGTGGKGGYLRFQVFIQTHAYNGTLVFD